MCTQKFLAVMFLLLGSFQSIFSNLIDGNNGGAKRLELADLYPDIQLLILDELDFPGCLSLADTNNKYSIFIADELKQKYMKDRVLTIVNPFFSITENVNNLVNGTDFIITNDRFIIKHLGAVLKVLRLLRGSVTKLSFECIYSNWHGVSPAVSEIGRYINRYCADSLIEFDIVIRDERFFEKMSTPFKLIKNVSIAGKFKKFDSETLAFEELFPAMRKLSLRNIKTPNGFIIDRTFSYLDEFYVEMSAHEKRVQENHVRALLLKNPQIRNFSFDNGSRSFLKFVSEHLPHLETLFINHHYDSNLPDQSSIVFENMKNFTVIAYSEDCLPNYTYFPNLIEFNAHVGDRSGIKLLDFVLNMTGSSSSLRKLNLKKYGRGEDDFLHNEQLEKLSEHALHLDEVQLTLSRKVSDESIIKFLRTNEEINKILLSRDNPPNSFENVINMIRIEFVDKWNIDESDTEISLESKF